jgi:hypothetical protein
VTNRVRALDENGDMQFGRGSRDYIVDIPEVVRQRAATRLGLWLGQWYRATDDGTPYRTMVFGMRTNATRDPAIRARILATPGCTGISAYASQQDRQARSWSVQARIDTQFGQVLVAQAIADPLADVRIAR